MSDTVIKVENLSKLYRLGEVGTGTLSHDLNRWYARIRGKEDPYSKVGHINDRTQKAERGEYVWALKDLNFEVGRGEVLGIIGRNGAGKSTLLKIMSRVTSPTEGEIKINGRVASLLEVGTGFHPEMTGIENIFMNGTLHGMSRLEVKKKLEEIVDFAGIAKYIDTPVKRYSSGMTVRLGFAIAAFLEPEILIVDEVLAVGDSEFQRKAIGKMEEVTKGGHRTVLFVSHNMASIQKLCNRCILLSMGKIIQNDNSEYVIQRYMHQLEGQALINLSNRRDRLGNQDIIITSLSFLDGISMKPIDTLVSGKEVVIEISYVVNHLENYKNVRLAIAFSHYLGGERFVVDNFYVDKPIGICESSGRIFCKIYKWPLNTGSYTYRIHLEHNGKLLDRVENAGVVRVEYGDFFNTGFKVPEHLNGSLVEHDWYK